MSDDKLKSELDGFFARALKETAQKVDEEIDRQKKSPFNKTVEEMDYWIARIRSQLHRNPKINWAILDGIKALKDRVAELEKANDELHRENVVLWGDANRLAQKPGRMGL